ncbi:MAG TPA: ThuA domain-containing protein [Candidatus Acidoferrales bacterium]|nr:ThuA domain-containing protein [Candidatus Acidoferrales bacterium]
MGSKKIAQLLTVTSAAFLLGIVGFAIRAQEAPAAAPAAPQALGAQGAPGAPGAPGRGRGGRGPTGRPPSSIDGAQNQTPWPWDVVAMEDAVPTKAYATPKQPRKILVLCKASGFVHSSIPLAAETIKDIGDKTGAWSATITYDPADINANNLQQYDLVFLDSTTGQFLDDPNNEEMTAERRQALLNFVRNGKGLAGVHAAVDSYHTSPSFGRGRGAAGASAAPPSPAEMQAARAAAESFVPTGTWPDYNKMIGGFFKWHWPYPQVITVKIDDAKSPLTQMFHGQEFVLHDETYTMAQDSYSLKNVHELTSIDYSKMSDADKEKEPAGSRRTDGDYGLSWVRREGKGRVFIEVLGHDEHVYEMPVMLEHLLAGTQYALGDLPANDAPTER